MIGKGPTSIKAFKTMCISINSEVQVHVSKEPLEVNFTKLNHMDLLQLKKLTLQNLVYGLDR